MPQRFVTCLLLAIAGSALPVPPAIATTAASAPQWIAPSLEDGSGVFDFRRLLALTAVPSSCTVNISADNRFQLFVNGHRLGEGPARGDRQHWRYESFNVAPFLHTGENVIAARVWNFKGALPGAQISSRTGMVLWTAPGCAPELATDARWQVRAETAWHYEPTGPPVNSLTGPNEVLDGHHYDAAWNTRQDRATWSPAIVLGSAVFAPNELPAPRATNWHLVPDHLPPMASVEGSAGRVVRSESIALAHFPSAPLHLSPHTHATLLLDHGTLTTAYPQLTVLKGEGSRIVLTYAEALVDEHGEKGNRNHIAGKHIDPRLPHDTFLPGGAQGPQTFEPLWWRTWRFVQVDITTGDQPLTLASFHARFTAYPFVERATFSSSDPELQRIWEVGWRTLRVDAHETYMDCPFYEQTQYIGDTRIEALVSYVMSGDDRLARQALLAFADSALPSGLTQSSFPVQGVQIIPPFSLLWIGMLHDFWQYRPGSESTLREMLPRVHAVLDHFRSLQRKDALLGKLPQDGFGYWNFLDWTSPYPVGAPPEDADGGSVPLSLQLAAALVDAADLESALGYPTRANADRAEADRINTSVLREAWDPRLGLLADTPAKTSFSQHANILGVLTGAIPTAQQQDVLRKILAGELGAPAPSDAPRLAPASYYFRFYLGRALDRAGMGDDYLETLGPWRHMLSLGLTTWAEQPEPTRSDAHAWSSHPNYDLLTLVAGIRPDAPGFARVLIEPHLGNLTRLSASMPMPGGGEVRVAYRVRNGTLDATIELPPSIRGRFLFAGQEHTLGGGRQHITLKLLRGGATRLSSERSPSLPGEGGR